MGKLEEQIEVLQAEIEKKEKKLRDMIYRPGREYQRYQNNCNALQEEIADLSLMLEDKEYVLKERSYQKSGVIEIRRSDKLSCFVELDHRGVEKKYKQKPKIYVGKKVKKGENFTSREESVTRALELGADAYYIVYHSKTWQEKDSSMSLYMCCDSIDEIKRAQEEDERKPLVTKWEDWKTVDYYKRIT